MNIQTVQRQALGAIPPSVRRQIKRWRYRSQIRRGTFASQEPEFAWLASVLKRGDCVIDVGANVGHYTSQMSRLVGPEGRVIAFEPVSETFALLTENCAAPNVTLINAAVSSIVRMVSMSVPVQSGLPNFYQAQISSGGELKSLALSIDSLYLPERVRLAKIDAEGHDAEVVQGMLGLIKRDRPTLIIESGDEVHDTLMSLDYTWEKFTGSPNIIYRAA